MTPYSFSERGALPSGVFFASNGNLSGTPTLPGSFPITITATGADGCQGAVKTTLTVGSGPLGKPPAAPQKPHAPTATLPSITFARLSRTAFRAAERESSLARRRRPPVGTTVSYHDSEAAVTTLTVLKPVTGHTKDRRCVAGQPRKHRPRCTRYVAYGSFGHVDTAGNVRIPFTGRAHGHKLNPGSYRLTLTPKFNGNAGRIVTLAFRIVK